MYHDKRVLPQIYGHKHARCTRNALNPAHGRAQSWATVITCVMTAEGLGGNVVGRREIARSLSVGWILKQPWRAVRPTRRYIDMVWGQRGWQIPWNGPRNRSIAEREEEREAFPPHPSAAARMRASWSVGRTCNMRHTAHTSARRRSACGCISLMIHEAVYLNLAVWAPWRGTRIPSFANCDLQIGWRRRIDGHVATCACFEVSFTFSPASHLYPVSLSRAIVFLHCLNIYTSLSVCLSLSLFFSPSFVRNYIDWFTIISSILDFFYCICIILLHSNANFNLH